MLSSMSSVKLVDRRPIWDVMQIVVLEWETVDLVVKAKFVV